MIRLVVMGRAEATAGLEACGGAAGEMSEPGAVGGPQVETCQAGGTTEILVH